MNLPTRTWKKRSDIKDKLEYLVGKRAKNPKLRNWRCHDVAYRHLDMVLHHNLREELYFEDGKYIAKSMRHDIVCRRCGYAIIECECE